MPEIKEQCSVELTRNAKGDTQISVKSRDDSIEVAGKAAEAEYNRLCEVYKLKG